MATSFGGVGNSRIYSVGEGTKALNFHTRQILHTSHSNGNDIYAYKNGRLTEEGPYEFALCSESQFSKSKI